jgi:hypothetical protein
VRVAVVLAVYILSVAAGFAVGFSASPVCPAVATPIPTAPTQLEFVAADGARLTVTVDGRTWHVAAREGTK